MYELFFLVLVTAGGAPNAAGPFPTEKSCNEMRDTLVASVEFMQQKGFQMPLTLLICKRVATAPEKNS